MEDNNFAFLESEDKTLFMVQYWRQQNVFVVDANNEIVGKHGQTVFAKNINWISNVNNKHFTLVLKNPLDLEYDDAIKFLELDYKNLIELPSITEIKNIDTSIYINTVYYGLEHEYEIDIKNLSQKQTDLFRKLGYLVPFLEYTINDIIKLGWARYKI